ncbi:MAG: helix-turn-helix transcriptional regulator [Candidatus Cloacimonetes bacterium]|nr:helix-turn-helix transcriptional regulator [Candidatus Cloacimonadota bacterium]
MKNEVRYYRFMRDEMTQQELADKVNVTRQTILAIEKSRFNPSVRLAMKIAEVLSVSIEKLFQLTEEDKE